jgi:L-galactono-1,4-lactone dehydrogenase
MQQWVWEVCFPTGEYENNNGNDILFMENLLRGIEELGIAAHSPIEQRWTASSSSLMSPAHGPANGLHTWVGIIMYLPSDDETQRRQNTETFTGQYCDLLQNVRTDLNATSLWAKLERPNSVMKLLRLQEFLSSRYPLAKFNETRASLDRNNILTSPVMNLILGEPKK